MKVITPSLTIPVLECDAQAVYSIFLVYQSLLYITLTLPVCCSVNDHCHISNVGMYTQWKCKLHK